MNVRRTIQNARRNRRRMRRLLKTLRIVKTVSRSVGMLRVARKAVRILASSRFILQFGRELR